MKRYKSAWETLKQHVPDHDAFIHSTVAARLNGFVKGYGRWEEIKTEIQDWGLSTTDQVELLEVLNSLRW